MAPCHFGTEVVGYVKGADGYPVKNAQVILYGYTVSTDENGCFYINQADALPFELSVKAEGFKSISSESRWGKYIVNVSLAPINSALNGAVIWGEEQAKVNKCT